MVDRAIQLIKAFSYFGAILGCTIAFIITAEIIPEFNSWFLTIHVDESGADVDKLINENIIGGIDLNFHDTIEDF